MAAPTELRVLSSLALASTLEALRPSLAAAGLTVAPTLLPTALLLPRIRAGETADVALLTHEGVAALAAEGMLQDTLPLALSRVGLAVRQGASRPAIGTRDELVATLLATPSIGLSRAGASGLFFAGLLDRLGIAAAVGAKATVIDSGFTAALLVEGRVALAVQQISELMMVPGIDVVGPLPEECGGGSVFSGGVFTASARQAESVALLRLIADAGPVLRACGLAPA